MRKLIDVYGGAGIFRRIAKGHKDVFFLLLTDNDEELNYYALEHLERCAKIRGFQSAQVICRESIRGQVEELCGDRFRIHVLGEVQTEKLIAYMLMCHTAAYIPTRDNIRMASLYRNNSGIEMLCEIGFFDKEYIVWNRMLFLFDEYGEFMRTAPYEKMRAGGIK